MGFWIRREVALEAGPISTDLSINEDTEYLCRLITAGKRGWYSARPGVIVHSHVGAATDIGNITKRTPPEERARCMRILCDRYPHMIGHLGSGYIRHCLKTGALAEAWGFVQQQQDWRVRNRFTLLMASKLVGYWVTGQLKTG